MLVALVRNTVIPYTPYAIKSVIIVHVRENITYPNIRVRVFHQYFIKRFEHVFRFLLHVLYLFRFRVPSLAFFQ